MILFIHCTRTCPTATGNPRVELFFSKSQTVIMLKTFRRDKITALFQNEKPHSSHSLCQISVTQPKITFLVYFSTSIFLTKARRLQSVHTRKWGEGSACHFHATIQMKRRCTHSTCVCSFQIDFCFLSRIVSM